MAKRNNSGIQSQLIGFERKMKAADPAIEPVVGKIGQCKLCGQRSRLTSSHVLPKAVGNAGPWLAQSYLTIATGQSQKFVRRRFPNGIEFFTTCKNCNNSLGAFEDKTLIETYETAHRIMKHPLNLPPTITFRTNLNRLFRAIIFHLATANDKSPDASLDETAQKLKSGIIHIAQSNLFFFVWPYIGDKHVIVRDFAWWNIKDNLQGYAHVLKLSPLGFAVTDTPKFKGMNSLNAYLTRDNDSYVDIPLDLFRQENHDIWPAAPSSWEAILRGNSMGMVSSRI